MALAKAAWGMSGGGMCNFLAAVKEKASHGEAAVL